MVRPLLQEKTIDAQVVFGAPSRNCAGSGVCKMLPRSFKASTEWQCQVYNAELHWRRSGIITLQVSLNAPNAAQVIGLGKTLFTVDEPYPLPLWLNKYWSVKGWSIAVGQYGFAFDSLREILQLNLHCKIQKRFKDLPPTNPRINTCRA